MKKCTLAVAILSGIFFIVGTTYTFKKLIRGMSRPTAGYESPFSTPISFYGMVIDQFGAPVPGAEVHLEANGHPSSGSPKRTVRSDSFGLFEIHDMHGIQLSVDISKAGYYKLMTGPAKIGSSAGFQYAAMGGQGTHVPDKAKPVVFSLQKQGTVEPLELLTSPHVGLRSDGEPTMLDLTTSENRAQRRITVRAWTTGQIVGDRGEYDWRAEIQVANGGILPRADKLDFIAPETGYHASESIEMPANLRSPTWKDVVDRMFFIRFSDGTSARIEVQIAAPPHGSVLVSGFLNPKIGSLNLEADPNLR